MKHFFDKVLALLILALLCAPILIISVTIYITSKDNGKPFFYQTRTGKNRKLFTIIKFKTMNDKTDENGELLPVKYRITKTGDFCRKYSLDEIPQLINILKGDMSLVGPGPALFNQNDLINLRSTYGVEKILPGLTGWAQVNGRDELSIVDKVALDIEYINRQSFWFDMKILWMTFLKVVRRVGVSH
jgi:O-antigen biosynthesis protein WbqP